VSSSYVTSDPGKLVSSISFYASSPEDVYSPAGNRRGPDLTLPSVVEILWRLPGIEVSLATLQKILHLSGSEYITDL
jgi:hypothetical protein